MSEDVTQRLRLSTDPDSVERERVMAGNLFGVWLQDRDRHPNPEEMRKIAERAIAASCIFWEQWDIATLTPDMSDSIEAIETTLNTGDNEWQSP